MKKKHFLLILPICVIFCLWFSSCDEYEQVDGLWEKLKNTAWERTEEEIITTWRSSSNQAMYGNGVRVIGFYGPRNGPSKNTATVGNDPYVANGGKYKSFSGTRYPGWTQPYTDTLNFFWSSTHIQFDRTGNEIIFYGGEKMTDDEGKEHRVSNRISVSGDKLTIKAPKGSDWGHLSEGTYRKISSDPNFNWGN